MLTGMRVDGPLGLRRRTGQWELDLALSGVCEEGGTDSNGSDLHDKLC
jgi:hypothetical protein